MKENVWNQAVWDEEESVWCKNPIPVKYADLSYSQLFNMAQDQERGQKITNHVMYFEIVSYTQTDIYMLTSKGETSFERVFCAP